MNKNDPPNLSSRSGGWSLADRDLLIRLDENMSGLRNEIQSLRNQLTSQISDHEARLRVMEAENDRNDGALRAMRWMMVAIGALAGIVEPIVLWMLNKKP